MHQLRKVPESMSDGSRGEQDLTQTKKCYGVHPLPKVYKGLPDKSADNIKTAF